LISTRTTRPHYGLTVTALVFSSIYILLSLASGGFFLGLAYDVDDDTLGGVIVLSVSGYVLFASQIICIIVASYETKRVPCNSIITTQKIVISTDPRTGQQFSQLIEEKIPKSSIPPEIQDPASMPSSRNQRGAIASIIITSVGVVILIIGSCVADSSIDQDKDFNYDYPVQLFMVVILTFPIIWIYISHIFLLISVYRTRTHHGFSVTALVFAIFTLIGGLIILIAYALISDSMSQMYRSYDYEDDCTYGYCTSAPRETTVGTKGQQAGYALVSFAGALIMVGQIVVVIFSAFEIRRRSAIKTNIVMVPPMNPYPVATNIGVQPQVYYAPPQNYPYNNSGQPPMYVNSDHVQV